MTLIAAPSTPAPPAALGSGGLVQYGGVLTSGGGETVCAVTLNGGRSNVNDPRALGTGLLTISGGTLDNTSNNPVTLSGNNAQNWNAGFVFGGSNP